MSDDASLCDNCRAREPEWACKRCHKAFYCSRECQNASWPEHRPGCCPASTRGTLTEHDGTSRVVWIPYRGLITVCARLLANGNAIMVGQPRDNKVLITATDTHFHGEEREATIREFFPGVFRTDFDIGTNIVGRRLELDAQLIDELEALCHAAIEEQ